MVETTADLVEGMREMRVRNAIMVTALVKLGGPLVVTHQDAFDASRYDIEVRQTPLGLNVRLVPAPTKTR